MIDGINLGAANCYTPDVPLIDRICLASDPGATSGPFSAAI